MEECNSDCVNYECIRHDETFDMNCSGWNCPGLNPHFCKNKKTNDPLLPCPFCGKIPNFPNGNGTQYEIWCDDCGMAVSSIQIPDVMTTEERQLDDFVNHRFKEEYIERAKAEATKKWNKRV